MHYITHKTPKQLRKRHVYDKITHKSVSGIIFINWYA